ncbi:hypothetical protein AMJ87_12840 [candidate division WOR_3 bacterium SM23_60]|uniref:Uncharacterized protein n=1 Tax=candidate division WOR_3 bacterium SM23_60 TaxID=1703780 RepID=A0A0S8G6K6_UNCW3|nr:MAG: hypothetical protein AMJ87_12840 [candidate division WOR_3 bacterium SM23_60]
MILLIEPDKTTRKNLCDLLNRERIIGVGTIAETLEIVCKFQRNLDIIIANIHIFAEILGRGTLLKLCEKLHINVPPTLVLYKKGEEEVRTAFHKKFKKYALIEYNEADQDFPEYYIDVVRTLYPGVVVDIDKAKEAWAKKEKRDDFDARGWLQEEGLLNADEVEKKEDYKKMYLDLKKKYDELTERLKKMTDLFEDS